MRLGLYIGENSLDSVRGIGFHTQNLVKNLELLDKKDLKTTYLYGKKIDFEKFDLVHITAFRPFQKSVLPFIKPKKIKIVLTIHDLIPLIYPDRYPPGIKGKINYFINLFKVKLVVDRIITISETSKKDICRFLKVKPDKVKVIYLAPRPTFKKVKVVKNYNVPKKFALYCGDVNYNKNIPNLVKACKMVKIPLVIAGKQAKEIENLDINHPELKHLKDINWDNVIRLGFITDSELNDLYNLCFCYVQPSLYEGFGLPVLEAAAADAPLVVAKTQALVEILGNDFDYMDGKNVKDMAKHILKPQKITNLPRNYSWNKCAKETLSLYESIQI